MTKLMMMCRMTALPPPMTKLMVMKDEGAAALLIRSEGGNLAAAACTSLVVVTMVATYEIEIHASDMHLKVTDEVELQQHSQAASLDHQSSAQAGLQNERGVRMI